MSSFRMFKRSSLLTRNSSLPLPALKDPYTPERACLHICIHLPQSSVFTENALIWHSKIYHTKIVSPWINPASPVTGSPAPSLPAVCPAHTSQTTASQNSLHSEADLPPHYHAPKPSPNSFQAPVLWHGLENLPTTGRMTASIWRTQWFLWKFVH